MADVTGVRLIRAADRSQGQATAGMHRQEAVVTGRMWAGILRTAPGVVAGWHHHGEYESVIYVLAGAFRMEFGSGGRGILEAGPGDFLFVEPRVVHRESNPGAEECVAVVFRSGSGEPVFNVDGPSPSD